MADDAAEHAISALIGQYFYGIDSGDRTLVFACFSEDARYEFVLEQVVLEGHADFVRIFGGETKQVSTHVVANQSITVRGREADADTFAVAYLVNGIAGQDRMLVRGLRYVDALRLSEEGWRITSRRHHSLWQFEADGVSPDMRARHPRFQNDGAKQ